MECAVESATLRSVTKNNGASLNARIIFEDLKMVSPSLGVESLFRHPCCRQSGREVSFRHGSGHGLVTVLVTIIRVP
jgi:hypothetical protein